MDIKCPIVKLLRLVLLLFPFATFLRLCLLPFFQLRINFAQEMKDQKTLRKGYCARDKAQNILRKGYCTRDFGYWNCFYFWNIEHLHIYNEQVYCTEYREDCLRRNSNHVNRHPHICRNSTFCHEITIFNLSTVAIFSWKYKLYFYYEELCLLGYYAVRLL
jgi:hypothetical protein